MNAGQLRNYLIDIYSLSTVREPFGSEQEVYTPLCENVRCHVADFQESRRSEGEEIEYGISRTFTVRRHYKNLIDEHSRIKYDGKFYRMDSIDVSRDTNSIVIRASKVNE
jgi:hypothetical protein